MTRGGFRRRAGRQEIIGQHDAFQGGFHGILFLELLQNHLATLQSEESSVQSLDANESKKGASVDTPLREAINRRLAGLLAGRLLPFNLS